MNEQNLQKPDIELDELTKLVKSLELDLSINYKRKSNRINSRGVKRRINKDECSS